MISVEFDQEKSRSNLEKHGIDFDEAKRLWEDQFRVIIPATCTDEKRWILIGRIGSECWTVVFTVRKPNVRIISVRKSRRNEEEVYFRGGI